MSRASLPFRLFLLRVLGTAAFSVGFVTFWLPIPIGLILMAFGLSLLLTSSRWTKSGVRRLRKRYPGLNRALARGAAKLPPKLRRSLDRTAPRQQAKKASAPAG